MKQILVLFVPLAALGAGLFYLFSVNPYEELAHQQLSLITEAVETISTFEESGNPSDAIARLKSLKKDFSDWSDNQNKLDEAGDKAPAEVLAEIEQRRGQLANAMIQLEISEHDGAPEVLAALESLVSQP